MTIINPQIGTLLTIIVLILLMWVGDMVFDSIFPKKRRKF